MFGRNYNFVPLASSSLMNKGSERGSKSCFYNLQSKMLKDKVVRFYKVEIEVKLFWQIELSKQSIF